MGAPELYIFMLNLEMRAPETHVYAKLENGGPWAIDFYAKFEK